MNSPDSQKAEEMFREAFDRLKQDCPKILGEGAKVSQNNVAKEAGRDSSALKKSRYPALIAEIQVWVQQNRVETANRSERLSPEKKRRVRALLERMGDLKKQRDHAMSLLIEANAKILDLTIENARLSGESVQSSVTEIRRR
ncbi:MAG: hypothetical protein V4448_02090 [Pseudomonadota bacterium]